MDGRAARLQAHAANGGAAAAENCPAAGDGNSSTLSSGSSNNVHTGTHSSGTIASAAPANASAVAAARLLRGALEAALLPRLEAMEGRIVEAVERRVVQRIMDMEQQREDKVGPRERQLTAALETVATMGAIMQRNQVQVQGQGERDQGQGQGRDHGPEQRNQVQGQGQGQADAQALAQEPPLAVTLAALEQRIREELKVRNVGWGVAAGVPVCVRGDVAVKSSVERWGWGGVQVGGAWASIESQDTHACSCACGSAAELLCCCRALSQCRLTPGLNLLTAESAVHWHLPQCSPTPAPSISFRCFLCDVVHNCCTTFTALTIKPCCWRIGHLDSVAQPWRLLACALL